MEIIIDRDGLPYIWANNKSVLFGYGENTLEYTWEDITKIIRDNYNREGGHKWNQNV